VQLLVKTHAKCSVQARRKLQHRAIIETKPKKEEESYASSVFLLEKKISFKFGLFYLNKAFRFDDRRDDHQSPPDIAALLTSKTVHGGV
jgi:hypothetical protein